MVVVAVAGGKGGTGKTIVAVGIACTLSRLGKTLLVDADVDNPCVRNCIRALQPEIAEYTRITRMLPEIDTTHCNQCGDCVNTCPEHALVSIPGRGIIVMQHLCAGCGCCVLVCKQGAIKEKTVDEGIVYRGKAGDVDLLIGELLPGEKRSYVVITRLVEQHRDLFAQYSFVVIDSPPGTGAGVFAILRNVDKIVLVTEPTPLGVADFEKLLSLIEQKIRKPVLVVINKATLSQELCEKVERLCSERSYPVLKIPYSRGIVEAYTRGVPVVMYEKVEKEVREVFERICEWIRSG